MQLEDYFDFLAPNAIRIKGHRINIEHVLYEYIHRGQTPEEIVKDTFPSLTLDKVYATILYYLRNKEEVDRYLTDWLEGYRTAREEAIRKNPEFYERMRRAWAEAEAKRHAQP